MNGWKSLAMNLKILGQLWLYWCFLIAKLYYIKQVSMFSCCCVFILIGYFILFSFIKILTLLGKKSLLFKLIDIFIQILSTVFFLHCFKFVFSCSFYFCTCFLFSQNRFPTHSCDVWGFCFLTSTSTYFIFIHKYNK